jgi:hypoxanthine-DNA glycosylase
MSVGFPPVARHDARVLILGSLPSKRSLAERQYYAHPQNAFWSIMRELVGATGSYENRCECLIAARIALWDVLKQSIRPGSMDADIQPARSEVNDFEEFMRDQPEIGLICFNGKKAEQMFHKFVQKETLGSTMRYEALPSTSPAYASMSFAEKLKMWRAVTS